MVTVSAAAEADDAGGASTALSMLLFVPRPTPMDIMVSTITLKNPMAMASAISVIAFPWLPSCTALSRLVHLALWMDQSAISARRNERRSQRMTERVLQGLAGGGAAHGTPSVRDLSDRELEVFSLIGQGFATSLIAEQLHLSVKTVVAHREKIKKKLHLNSGSELTRYAVQWTLGQG